MSMQLQEAEEEQEEHALASMESGKPAEEIPEEEPEGPISQ